MSYYIEPLIQVLQIASKVEKGTKSITIDSGIYSHFIEVKHTNNKDYDRLSRKYNPKKDIYKLRATNDDPIKLDNIICIFQKMQQQFEKLKNNTNDDIGTYIFDGVRYNKKSHTWEIMWGT